MTLKRFSITAGSLITIASVTGIVLIACNTWDITDKPPQTKMELMKFLFQVLQVIILGTIASLVVAEFNRMRQKAEAIDEFRRSLLDKLVRAFSSAKKARRLLRAGRSVVAYDRQRAVVILIVENAELLPMFNAQMEAVIDAQLELETIGQSIETARYAFSNPDTLLHDIESMDGYLKGIISEYERLSPLLRKDPTSLSTKDISYLIDYIGPYGDSDFRYKFKKKYDYALNSVRNDILMAHRATRPNKALDRSRRSRFLPYRFGFPKWFRFKRRPGQLGR